MLREQLDPDTPLRQWNDVTSVVHINCQCPVTCNTRDDAKILSRKIAIVIIWEIRKAVRVDSER